MDINEEIKKQEILLEEINSKLDNLINEYGVKDILGDVGTLLTTGPWGLVRKKAAKSAMDDLKTKKKKLKEKNDDEEDEGENKKQKKEMEELKKSIEELQSLIKKNKKSGGVSYGEIVFKLDNDVTLKIEKYGVDNYEHTLNKGKILKYRVSEVNQEDGYLIIREAKMKSNFKIKLDFKNLNVGERQEDFIRLMYTKGKNEIYGNRKKVKYIIKSLK